jgi:hypothetical protein
MAVPQVENARGVVAPTKKGVFLLRSLIEDKDRLGDLIKIHKPATAGRLSR